MSKSLSLFLVTSYLILEASIFLGGQPREDHFLSFNHLPKQWDEALPLGNGMLGILVYEKNKHIRLSLDRADLWDLREVKGLKDHNWAWVVDRVKSNNYKAVQQWGDLPYDRDPYPTKIPAAAIEFDSEEWGNVLHAQLDIKSAIAKVEWANGVKMETFVHATEAMGWFSFTGLPSKPKPILCPPGYTKSNNDIAGNAQSFHGLEKLHYPKGEIKEDDHSIIYRQEGAEGMYYIVAVSWQYQDHSLTGLWSISSHYPDLAKNLTATEVVEEGITKSIDYFRENHLDYWDNYWSQSSIGIPDDIIERQYYLDMYKWACVARPGAPAITLQAVWTADNGNLPPWKGDFHHDLNTQLSYWPGYVSNHLDLSQSFTDWLWSIKEQCKEYSQWYFGTTGLNVPGVSTLIGQPMGGWIQYSMSPTVSAWLAQYFYWQWKFSGDRSFLEQRAYPYFQEVARHLEELTSMRNGYRMLPLSSSPEYNNNSKEAWFSNYSNYDLALVKYTFLKASELAHNVGDLMSENKYRKILTELPDWDLDDKGGLTIAPGHPYQGSHRHFSHLLAIHPLAIIDIENNDSLSNDSSIVEASIRNLETGGSSHWVGYSFAWMANLYARTYQGDKAAAELRKFANNFVSSNSFHLNGDQNNGEFSNFTYRPFTLEGNFASAAGVQEMLLQSHRSYIEVFPAIPSSWDKVRFSGLRAQGGIVVSATKHRDMIEVVLSSNQPTTFHLKIGNNNRLINLLGISDNNSKFKNGILDISINANQKITVQYQLANF
ncbi:glycosyl hydrolase family 95 catalytic domain-containing protein [Membranihabitans marinus]|uniref:glycosyl hydrolase family 95 catalytic domain-containing protein n=1 Tax=Membranihabitans marinus TaxID=1227546 RepID=UPI001F17B0A7|nr:hypothetical protein [Membranihabitans marinus]